MELIIKYLGADQIYKYPKISAINLTIVKYSDIYNTIIPFLFFCFFFFLQKSSFAFAMKWKQRLLDVKLYDFIDLM